VKGQKNQSLSVSFLLLLLFSSGKSVAGWRSEMFPNDWKPLDEEIIDGVNRFFDPRGTRDYYGNEVSEGHPAYHPYRFLHDFSYAGYHAGERLIPPEDPAAVDPGPIFDVTVPPYGCVPDGVQDSRPGIQRAIDDAELAGGGVVFLPAGEYRIVSANDEDFLRIEKSRIVLRGAGIGQTRLKVDPFQNGVFNMHRKQVIKVVGGKPWLQDARSSRVRVPILSDLACPTKDIPVASVAPFKENDSIILQGRRTDAFLAEHDMAGTWKPSEPAYMFRRTIVGMDAARNVLRIDVPTRYRIKLSDLPEVVNVPPGISEVGLENFSMGMIRHPDEWFFSGNIFAARDALTPPIVHDLWQTRAIQLINVSNGWIYRVSSYRPAENAGRFPANRFTRKKFGNYEVNILNEAVLIEECRHITLKELSFKNSQVDFGNANGYTMRVSGEEVLLDHVTVEKCKKGFAIMDQWASGNVIKDSVTRSSFAAPDLLHWELSMANLIDNHVLDGTWWSAFIQGLDSEGQGHSTTEAVFWNVLGLRRPDANLIRSVGDRDNDLDLIPDPLEPHGDLPDVAIVISHQYGWGYVIGTHGPFSVALTPRVQRAVNGDWSRPVAFPPDYREGIGYDRGPTPAGSLEPRSLYEAQLSLRLGPRKPGNFPPTAEIDVVAPSRAASGEAVSFRGHGLDLDGKVVSYRWRSSLDGVLSRQASFTTSALSPGSHQLFFRVADDRGLSSAEVRAGLLVFPPPGGPVLLDNGDPGTSFSGWWSVSGAPHPFRASSIYSRQAGATYSYDVLLPSPGDYQVSLWWTTWPSRETAVPVEVAHALGTSSVTVDQQTGGGQWVPIGIWTFGARADVKITSLGPGSTSVDAVMLIMKGG
jgi:hypothetical protein